MNGLIYLVYFMVFLAVVAIYDYWCRYDQCQEPEMGWDMRRKLDKALIEIKAELKNGKV